MLLLWCYCARPQGFSLILKNSTGLKFGVYDCKESGNPLAVRVGVPEDSRDFFF